MADYYVLDDADHPVAVTRQQWFDWVVNREERKIDWRKVALTELDDVPGKPVVSTVFLGRNHQYGAGPPILYETMVFWAGSHFDTHCERYRTRDEALFGHEHMVGIVQLFAKSGKEPDDV